MFDQLFKRRHAVQRHLTAPLLEERLQYLHHCAEQGYTHATLRSLAASLLVIQDLLSLARSADPVDLATIAVAADRWIRRRPRHFNRQRGYRGQEHWISCAVNWLRFLGRLSLATDPLAAHAQLLQEFADYMRREKGLSERTIKTRCFYVRDFLSRFGPDRFLSEVTITYLDEAVARKGRDDGYSRLSVQVYASGLRNFFRYAASRGLCAPELADLIASPRIYQEETLPAGPAWDDVQRLIATTAGDRPKDIRDRAILLLLTVYGLRSGELRTLKLEDLDWEKSLLFVRRAKDRRRETYPLSHTVGEAILRYLKAVRPRSSYREVFLTMEAPIQPLRGSSLWTMVAKRFHALDLRLRHYGPHMLRHACATHLLARGLSLKEIGDHLGHRLPRTTAVYAKVNLTGLREVADFSLGGLL